MEPAVLVTLIDLEIGTDGAGANTEPTVLVTVLGEEIGTDVIVGVETSLPAGEPGSTFGGSVEPEPSVPLPLFGGGRAATSKAFLRALAAPPSPFTTTHDHWPTSLAVRAGMFPTIFVGLQVILEMLSSLPSFMNFTTDGLSNPVPWIVTICDALPDATFA